MFYCDHPAFSVKCPSDDTSVLVPFNLELGFEFQQHHKHLQSGTEASTTGSTLDKKRWPTQKLSGWKFPCSYVFPYWWPFCSSRLYLGHSPMMPLKNKALLPAEVLLTGIYFFFFNAPWDIRDWRVSEKIPAHQLTQIIEYFWNTQTRSKP